MGGSMGSVVGEKITRLVEYATNQVFQYVHHKRFLDPNKPNAK